MSCFMYLHTLEGVQAKKKKAEKKKEAPFCLVKELALSILSR